METSCHRKVGGPRPSPIQNGTLLKGLWMPLAISSLKQTFKPTLIAEIFHDLNRLNIGARIFRNKLHFQMQTAFLK